MNLKIHQAGQFDSETGVQKCLSCGTRLNFAPEGWTPSHWEEGVMVVSGPRGKRTANAKDIVEIRRCGKGGGK